MTLFRGKRALVTGGARGIGLAVAGELARLGAHVTLADNGCDVNGGEPDESVARSAAAALSANGDRVDADPRDICTYGRDMIAEHAPDLLIGCAGISGYGALGRVEPSFALVSAHLAMAVAAQGQMRPGSRILLTVDPVMFVGAARRAMDAAISGALVGFIRCAGLELRKRQIVLCGVAPTARTRLTESLTIFQGAAADSLTAAHAAAMYRFLAHTDEAIHGQVYGIAGDRAYRIAVTESDGAFAEDTSPFSDEMLAREWNHIER